MAGSYDRSHYVLLPRWYARICTIATGASWRAASGSRSVTVCDAARGNIARRHDSGVGIKVRDKRPDRREGVGTTYFDAVITIVGVVTLWFSRSVQARGWIA
ncbi:hypothetical protein F1C10_05735 [Sphingomonas sp. NBWT7]|uniref:hypothetical protein n=1 Tax=Sphingomonas sp. NBWT7 TaxID=2596913 RepID=UPI001624B101|nr:hypothetical protein [Sphingomonas sp. NBWT7]QNE31482.1 hypothetical protein F1C10_05735 [Sphingomonas sp. NBWT7]